MVVATALLYNSLDEKERMDIILSSHALYRIGRRGLLEDDMILALKYPDKIRKAHGKYFYQKDIGRGTIELCCEHRENNIYVLTLYWI